MIALLLCVAQDAWVVERQVTIVARDWLNERTEVRGRQTITLWNGNVRIDDVTWGTSVLIRPDEGRVWKIDPYLGEYSVWTFDELRADRERRVREIQGVLWRVAGSDDEAELRAILLWFNAAPVEGAVEIENGATSTVDGREAREITLKQGGRTLLRVSVWEGGPSYFGPIAAILGFSPEVAARLAEVRGLPLSGRERYVLLDRSVVVDFTTTRVEAVAADPLLFHVLETYRQVPP